MSSPDKKPARKKILFQMTGSIACFKACSVISKLAQKNHQVQVVASKSALEFVGSATLEGLSGRPVVSDLWERGHMMDHIHLVREADLIIVAPASASFINRIGQGVGDDLLTTMFLAHDFKKPFLLAPAMNTSMYMHPITQKSIAQLREMGVEILETASGVLACGENGLGRLLEPDLILGEIEKYWNDLSIPSLEEPPKALSRNLATNVEGLDFIDTDKMAATAKILITSGGTSEPIDQVRVLTNKSTGSTGAVLADTLSQLGFSVTHLRAQNAVPSQFCDKVETFETFADLQFKMHQLLRSEKYTAVIHAAAVSDFSVDHATGGKLSSDSDLTLHLKKNPKLVDHIRKWSKNPEVLVIAFKMTATDSPEEQQNAIDKLVAHARPDVVIHNDVKDIQPDRHVFNVYSSVAGQGEIKTEPQTLSSKQNLAAWMAQYLSEGDSLWF